jgi:phosphoglycolate phosphatase-like HAD superfamily hydrolase
MNLSDYTIIQVNKEKAYVRNDRLSFISHINGIIFDCDGVLIDIRESYDKAIQKVVVYILKGLLGLDIPKNIASEEVIYNFRKSSGFNNDWDTVYGILMFILLNLPKEIKEILIKNINKAQKKIQPNKRFQIIKKEPSKKLFLKIINQKFFDDLTPRLIDFTDLLDETGIESVDKNLLLSKKLFHINVFKDFLYYPAKVGESIIATIFEEFFCGGKLYEDIFSIKPLFNNGYGMIKNEKLIIQTENLDNLIKFLGKPNLGIASGSRRKTARYILGDILKKFDLKALVFQEEVQRAENEKTKKNKKHIQLKKPHPFSLFTVAKAFDTSANILFVGDSMEDFVMVSKARNTDKRFLFAGVYQHSSYKNALFHSFYEVGCDIIIPSVKDLFYVLKKIKSDKNEK